PWRARALPAPGALRRRASFPAMDAWSRRLRRKGSCASSEAGQPPRPATQMLLLASVVAAVTAGPVTTADVEALEKMWPGVRDSTEEVFFSSDPNVSAWGEGSEKRVRTVVA